MALGDGEEQAERDDHQQDLGIAVLLADVARRGALGRPRRSRPRSSADGRDGRLGEAEVVVVVRRRRGLVEAQGAEGAGDQDDDPGEHDDRLPRADDVGQQEVQADALQQERDDGVERRRDVVRQMPADELDEEEPDDPREGRGDDDRLPLEDQVGRERRDEHRRHQGGDEERDVVELDGDDGGVAVQDEDDDDGRDRRAHDHADREHAQADRDDRHRGLATARIAMAPARVTARIAAIAAQRCRAASPAGSGARVGGRGAGHSVRPPRRGRVGRQRQRRRPAPRPWRVVRAGPRRVPAVDPASAGDVDDGLQRGGVHEHEVRRHRHSFVDRSAIAGRRPIPASP